MMIDRNAEIPDHAWYPASVVRTRMLRECARLAQNGPLKVLDIGCGSAALWERFLPAEPAVTLYGFDPFKAGIERGRHRLGVRGQNLVHGTVDQPPSLIIKAAPFDVVVSHSVLEHVYRQDNFWSCLNNTTREGSVLLLSWGTDHFKQGLKTDIRNGISRMLAFCGMERWYAKDVNDEAALSALDSLGFEVISHRLHSIVQLKKQYRNISEEAARKRWLSMMMDIDEFLNQYHDNRRQHRAMIDEVFVHAVRKSS